jgi:hypothetical protein
MSIYNVKNFLGASPRTPFKGKEGEERDGKGASQIKFYDHSTDWVMSV